MLTITHTPEAGTLAEGTERGDGTAPILKAAGFRWSRNLGAWFVPRSRYSLPHRARIERAAEGLRGAGFAVDVAIDASPVDPAEREAHRDRRSLERHDGLTARAERKGEEATAAYERSRAATEGIPFGQPILVGHHSERRHRAALRRSDQAMARMSEAMAEQRSATDRASGAVAAARRRQTPAFIGNRIRECEAEERRLSRILSGAQGIGGPATGEYRTETGARLAQTRADLAHWRGELEALEAAGVRLWARADFTPGDRVKVKGSWGTVVRASSKTLAVDTGHMPWPLKYRYTEVSENAGPAPAEVAAEVENVRQVDDAGQLSLEGGAA